MAKILSHERIVEYSREFKVRVVKLTDQLEAKTTTIAEVLGLHPVMVYRWRQEYREGKLAENPSRRISMTKAPKPKTNDDELKRLSKQVKELEKENAFLKKWERYLKDQKQKGSNS